MAVHGSPLKGECELQAPLQALLTAPTKFKPESSRQGNGSARFASKSRLSLGSPATPKRARGPSNGPEPQTVPSPCTPTTNLKMLTKMASLDDVQLLQISKKALFHQDQPSPRPLGDQNSLGKRPLHSSSSENNGEICGNECTEAAIRLNNALHTESVASSQSPNVLKTTHFTLSTLKGHSSEIASSQPIETSNTVGSCLTDECDAATVKPSALVSSTPSTSASMIQPLSSYCSSLDPDDRLDETPLISPASFTGGVFSTNKDFSSQIHFNFDSNSSLKAKQNLQSSSASTCNRVGGAESNIFKSVRHRRDSEQSLSSGIISSSQQSSDCSLSRSNSSTSLATNITGSSNDSLCVADCSSVVLLKHPSEISRRDKSLGLLGERFLEVFPLNVSGPESPRRLVLDEVATQLSTERRRIYDIVNVLESLNMANKVGKNVYQWSGSQHLLDTLARLKALGDSLELPRLMAALLDHGIPFKFPAVSVVVSSASVDTRREKSLGIICQKLLMLLLAAPHPKIISMEAAVQVIVCGDCDLSPTAANKPSGAGTLRKSGSNACSGGALSRTVSESRMVSLPCLPSRNDNLSSSSLGRSSSAWSDAGDSGCGDTSYLQSPCLEDSQEGGKASKSCGAGQQQRARGRRMYDIANVLSALGLVARLPASRSLQYVGPLDLPTLDLQQDEDWFSSCQRQSLLRCRQPSGQVTPGSGAAVKDMSTARPSGSVRGTTATINCRSVQQLAQHTLTNQHRVAQQVDTSVSKPPCVQHFLSFPSSVPCNDNNVCRSSLPCSAQCSPVPAVSCNGAPSTSADCHLSLIGCYGIARNSSGTSLTRTLGKKTSSLLEVAELELQRLLAEEREAKDRQDQLKRLHYLVSPGYCQELQARRSIPATRAGPVVTKVSGGTFAVPVGTAPRSPLVVTRALPLVLVRGAAPLHTQATGVKGGRQATLPHVVTGQQQQRPLHTGQQRAQNIIVLKEPQHTGQQRQPVPPLASSAPQQHEASNTGSRTSPLTYIKPVLRSPLFHNIDRARILTLNKNQSFRLLPQLRSPRIALSFPESPANAAADACEGGFTSEGILQPINLSLKGSSEAQCPVNSPTASLKGSREAQGQVNASTGP